jgi:hypothetical protein
MESASVVDFLAILPPELRWKIFTFGAHPLALEMKESHAQQFLITLFRNPVGPGGKRRIPIVGNPRKFTKSFPSTRQARGRDTMLRDLSFKHAITLQRQVWVQSRLSPPPPPPPPPRYPPSAQLELFEEV